MAEDLNFQAFKEYLDAPKVGVVNMVRQQDLLDAYVKIKPLILSQDPDATIEIIEGALQLGTMAIRAVTVDVTVYDTEAFSAAIQRADNFQICPTNDDRVQLDISFEGVITYTLTE